MPQNPTDTVPCLHRLDPAAPDCHAYLLPARKGRTNHHRNCSLVSPSDGKHDIALCCDDHTADPHQARLDDENFARKLTNISHSAQELLRQVQQANVRETFDSTISSFHITLRLCDPCMPQIQQAPHTTHEQPNRNALPMEKPRLRPDGRTLRELCLPDPRP